MTFDQDAQLHTLSCAWLNGFLLITISLSETSQ